jgi:hypothetical protein
MSSKNVITSRASSVASRSKTIEYTEAKIPEHSNDFVNQFKTASSARKDFSNEHIINVLPNFVPILCYILYHINQYTAALEATKHAKISAATFTAYCLAIIYGYILTCDLHVRPFPSVHATLYDLDLHRKNFAEFLLTLPVPDFLEPILRQLTPTHDEFRSNIFFVPSAAGFTYTTHFGRFFPLIMFTNIHDVASETESRSSSLAILSELFRRPVYTILNVATNVRTFTTSIGHFIGAGININNTPSHYNSKLYQLFRSLFNPVLFRDYQRRQTLASVSLSACTYTDRYVNFYDLVFSAKAQNLNELRVVFSSIAGAMKGNIKCPGDLASFFSNMSGSTILSHGYSQFALPTWFHSPIVYGNNNGTELTALTRVDPSTFATAINFLETPAPTVGTTQTQPSGTCTVDRAHRITVSFTSLLNRLSPTPATGNTPNFSNDFVVFNEDEHLFPPVQVLDPSGASTIDAWKVTAFGMVIETMDIDGTVIAVPNPRLALGIENSWFADSAIPIRYTLWTIYGVNSTHDPARARRRVIAPRQTRFPAASLLVDRTTVNLPRSAPTTVALSTPGNAFPGLSFLNDVTWLQMVQSFLGFRTSDVRDNDSASDSIPGMTTGRLLVWSPYTYVGFEQDSLEGINSSSKIYYITNLRTMFGTRVPLVEVSHPYDAMPIF